MMMYDPSYSLVQEIVPRLTIPTNALRGFVHIIMYCGITTNVCIMTHLDLALRNYNLVSVVWLLKRARV